MLDGLDEVITRDERFFTYLEDRITTPRSRPAILVCVRDSLLETSDDLTDFINDYHAVVKLYKLQPWTLDAKRRFAYIRLNGHAPRPGEKDSKDVSTFVEAIRRQPTLDHLSSTPFYADLLLDNFHAGSDAREVQDEVELIDLALRRMCKREYQKGALREDILPTDALIEWLEELAAISYEGRGVSVRELAELASVVPALVQQDLSESDMEALVAQIEMLPFFQPSPVTRRIEFTHEIVAELLAARRFLRDLRAGDPRFAARVSIRPWPADSVFFRILTGIDTSARLIDTYRSESLRPIARRNVVQLIVLSLAPNVPFARSGISLEGVGLEGLVFESLNLDEVSFRSCDLTNTTFNNCSMRGVRFEGAVLKRTKFAKDTDKKLEAASFGNCEHLESVIVGGRHLEDDGALGRWVSEATGTSHGKGSCATKRQLHHLFRKFVHVNGQARRDDLDRRGLERGKQYSGAPDPGECVDRVLRSGYLEVESRSKRIRRPQGEKYAEIVNFVKGADVSEGLTAVLNSLCSKPGCSHE